MMPNANHIRWKKNTHTQQYPLIELTLFFAGAVTEEITKPKTQPKLYPYLEPSLNHTWWRHQMEAFFALLALCAGNSPVPGQFPAQRPVTESFDVFFDLRLDKRLSKESWGWWFETLSCPLWRHRNASVESTHWWSSNLTFSINGAQQWTHPHRVQQHSYPSLDPQLMPSMTESTTWLSRMFGENCTRQGLCKFVALFL